MLADAMAELKKAWEDVLRGASPKPTKGFPYRLRDDFLSRAEHSIYLVLITAVSDWAVVCPKVSLSDLFFAGGADYRRSQSYMNKIGRRHVDFLLCDPKTLRPLVGIELGDPSHGRRDGPERDSFIDAVFQGAKLPLVRMSAWRRYDVAELSALLRERAAQGGPQATAPQDLPQRESPDSGTPLCPKCGAPMVLRTATRGPNAGTQFWGCPNYPRCQGVLQIGEDL
jgi:hypothetical protein